MRKPGNRPEHIELPAEPLLNEEQRAALDAALAKKRLEQGGLISQFSLLYGTRHEDSGRYLDISGLNTHPTFHKLDINIHSLTY